MASSQKGPSIIKRKCPSSLSRSVIGLYFIILISVSNVVAIIVIVVTLYVPKVIIVNRALDVFSALLHFGRDVVFVFVVCDFFAV